MCARTVPGPEKQPQLREFLDEPDTPLDIRVPPPRKQNNKITKLTVGLLIIAFNPDRTCHLVGTIALRIHALDITHPIKHKLP